MSLFNIFKNNKNEASQANNNNNNNNNIDNTTLQNTILNISKIISNNDNDVINEINNLINNKEIYLQNNERGLDEHCNNKDLFWLIMVDTLEKYNYVCELDWKCEFEDFIYFLSNLTKFNLNINDDIFNKDDCITEWCKIIDDFCAPNCIGCIDINSDSYVIFISNNDEIIELNNIAKQISNKIYYAKHC